MRTIRTVARIDRLATSCGSNDGPVSAALVDTTENAGGWN